MYFSSSISERCSCSTIYFDKAFISIPSPIADKLKKLMEYYGVKVITNKAVSNIYERNIAIQIHQRGVKAYSAFIEKQKCKCIKYG